VPAGPMAPPPIAVPVMPMAPPQYGGGGMVLQSGFLPDPRTFNGVSGGPISASAMNPSCRGYINPVPNHVVTLTSFFPFLRFWAGSSGDTTLFIRTPTGQVFCADDTFGFNPGVDLRGATPGSYQVFVGSYSQGSNYPYTLGVSESPVSTPTGMAAPVAPPIAVAPPPMMGGGAALNSGFMPDPRYFSGVSGGPISAGSFNPQCRGSIPPAPQHTLYLTTPFAFLRIYAQSQGDLTLFIRGPRGETYCADDTYGLNPGVDLAGAMPGPYQVFVGTYGGGNYPYTLGVTELQYNHP